MTKSAGGIEVKTIEAIGTSTSRVDDNIKYADISE
jgi:hypothetical protein